MDVTRNALITMLIIISTIVLSSLAFVPTVVGVQEQPIQTYNVLQSLALPSLERGLNHVVAWSPDGETLAVAGDYSVWLYSADTFEPVGHFEGHTNVVTSLAWSPDSRSLASGHGGGEIKIWEADTGSEVRTIVVPERCTVTTLDWSPDGTQIASTGDIFGTRTARTWPRSAPACSPPTRPARR